MRGYPSYRSNYRKGDKKGKIGENEIEQQP